mmetsp:Transcript_76758/g.126599  ORF Transcript_76758/g.126599 Transcript_76758/m.126599 type:complete len:122 (+) Transcript_76758:189-554(+)
MLSRDHSCFGKGMTSLRKVTSFATTISAGISSRTFVSLIHVLGDESRTGMAANGLSPMPPPSTFSDFLINFQCQGLHLLNLQLGVLLPNLRQYQIHPLLNFKDWMNQWRLRDPTHGTQSNQ